MVRQLDGENSISDWVVNSRFFELVGFLPKMENFIGKIDKVRKEIELAWLMINSVHRQAPFGKNSAVKSWIKSTKRYLSPRFVARQVGLDAQSILRLDEHAENHQYSVEKSLVFQAVNIKRQLVGHLIPYLIAQNYLIVSRLLRPTGKNNLNLNIFGN